MGNFAENLNLGNRLIVSAPPPMSKSSKFCESGLSDFVQISPACGKNIY